MVRTDARRRIRRSLCSRPSPRGSRRTRRSPDRRATVRPAHQSIPRNSCRMSLREKETVMKKILAILALVLVSAAAAASPPADVTQALTKLENDWAKMALSGDASGLEKLLTSDYVYTNQDGEMATRADMISSMKSGGTKYDTF